MKFTSIQIDAELCKRSFRYFVEQAWPILEPFRKFVPGIHTDAICEVLQAITEGKLNKLIINIAPRFGKSILVSVAWPAWEWLNKPHQRYLCHSYGDSLAIEHAVKCRSLIQSQWYQERFGHIYQLSGDQNQKQKYENNKTGFRISGGMSGTLGKGGSRLILDDPHSTHSAISDVERKTTLDFYDNTLVTRSGYFGDAATVLVMQRLHQDDMTQHLLELGFYHLCLPNEFEPDRKCIIDVPPSSHKLITNQDIDPESVMEICAKEEKGFYWEDPRTEPDELLWPLGCDEAATTQLKGKGSLVYASQFQQRPIPPGGYLIRDEWWMYYTALPSRREGNELVLDFDEQLFAWDMTFDGKEKSDFVVGQLWGMKGSQYYLIDQVRGRWDFTQTLQKFISFSSKYPDVWTKLIENKANGPAIISTMKSHINGIIAIDPKTSKEARVMAITPLVEAQNVYLPDPSIAPWIKSFVEEASYFPKGTHDDQIDCAAYALFRLSKFSGTNILKFYAEENAAIRTNLL